MDGLFGPQEAGPDHGMEFSDGFIERFDAIKRETHSQAITILSSKN